MRVCQYWRSIITRRLKPGPSRVRHSEAGDPTEAFAHRLEKDSQRYRTRFKGRTLGRLFNLLTASNSFRLCSARASSWTAYDLDRPRDRPIRGQLAPRLGGDVDDRGKSAKSPKGGSGVAAHHGGRYTARGDDGFRLGCSTHEFESTGPGDRVWRRVGRGQGPARDEKLVWCVKVESGRVG